MSRSEETKAPLETMSEDWSLLPWRQLEQHVYRLQKRIYRAAERGNTQAVHRLQQWLVSSRSARFIAVRRVTQANQGKKPAGGDGKAALTPPERLALTQAIHPKLQSRRKAQPGRRVWLAKPGKQEMRPLGIPVMYDRACQALAKQALGPEWEARCELKRYGFRPGRGHHDALGAIFDAIRLKPKWVLDADIKGCFDRIRHPARLSKLATYPARGRQIQGWLKAGIIEANVFSPVEEGTPQGGVASPLLANVALHGMERRGHQAFTNREGKPTLVRSAEDFVVFHPTKAGVEKARTVIEAWLKDIGLELKPSKTRITHTLEGEAGVAFLGFTIRQDPVGVAHSGKTRTGIPPGFKTLIQPGAEAGKRHVAEPGKMVREQRDAPQEGLIAHLNPVMQGWANYKRTVVSKVIFTRCDHRLSSMLRRWARRRHPKKSARWVTHKYWAVDQGEGWTFRTQDGAVLKTHAATPIRRPTKVKGTASPYDGNLISWAQRRKDHPLANTKAGDLLKYQRGHGVYCGLLFTPGDVLEIDHLIPRRLGGTDRVVHLQLLHRHCHDQKTATLDAALARAKAEVAMTEDHLIEEPCAEKSASTVLKGGG